MWKHVCSKCAAFVIILVFVLKTVIYLVQLMVYIRDQCEFYVGLLSAFNYDCLVGGL